MIKLYQDLNVKRRHKKERGACDIRTMGLARLRLEKRRDGKPKKKSPKVDHAEVPSSQAVDLAKLHKRLSLETKHLFW